MSLEELINVCPPPANVIKPPGDRLYLPAWLAELNLDFLSDFLELCQAYGTGRFFGWVQIYNPLFPVYPSEVTSDRNWLVEKKQYGSFFIPFRVLPRMPGLLPLGHSEPVSMYWLIDRGHKEWPIILVHEDPADFEADYEEWNMSLTTFLARYATDDLGSFLLSPPDPLKPGFVPQLIGSDPMPEESIEGHEDCDVEFPSDDDEDDYEDAYEEEDDDEDYDEDDE